MSWRYGAGVIHVFAGACYAAVIVGEIWWLATTQSRCRSITDHRLLHATPRKKHQQHVGGEKRPRLRHHARAAKRPLFLCATGVNLCYRPSSWLGVNSQSFAHISSRRNNEAISRRVLESVCKHDPYSIAKFVSFDSSTSLKIGHHERPTELEFGRDQCSGSLLVRPGVSTGPQALLWSWARRG